MDVEAHYHLVVENRQVDQMTRIFATDFAARGDWNNIGLVSDSEKTTLELYKNGLPWMSTSKALSGQTILPLNPRPGIYLGAGALIMANLPDDSVAPAIISDLC